MDQHRFFHYLRHGKSGWLEPSRGGMLLLRIILPRIRHISRGLFQVVSISCGLVRKNLSGAAWNLAKEYAPAASRIWLAVLTVGGSELVIRNWGAIKDQGGCH